MTKFNVETELARLKAETRVRRKARFKNSKLNSYRGELMALRNSGATIAELQRWLKTKKISVVWTTVKRWLDNHG